MALIVNSRSELIREPNLLIPGKKPVGAVKVDTEHSIGKMVEIAFLGNAPVDIARGKVLTPYSMSFATVGDKGVCANFSGSGSYIGDLDYILNVDSPWSVMWLEYLDSVALSDGVFVFDTNQEDEFLHIYGSNHASYRDFTIGGTSSTGNTYGQCTFTPGTNTPTGVWRQVIVAHRGGIGWEKYSGWANGVALNTVDGGAFGDVPAGSRLSRTGADSMQGKLGYFFLFEGEISDVEARSLYEDPFQFLVPA